MSEILTDICIKIVLKKSICKETSCYCSHEILDPIPTRIVILPFIFCPLLSCIYLSVPIFSPYHLLEKYNSHFKTIPLFLFSSGKYKVKCFSESGNREARWPFEQRASDGYLPIWQLQIVTLVCCTGYSVEQRKEQSFETRTRYQMRS